MSRNSSLNKTYLTLLLTSILTACGGDDTENATSPPQNSDACVVTGSQAAQLAATNYEGLMNSLSQSSNNNNEFSSRTGTFEQVYNLGQFLTDGDFQRQIEVTELNPTQLGNSSLSGGYETGYINSNTDSSSLQGELIKELVGFDIALAHAKSLKTTENTYVKYSVSFDDVIYRQVDNTQEVIDRNIINAPNSNEFVYGIYQAKITNKFEIKTECNEEVSSNSSAQIAALQTQLENSTVSKGESSNEIIITSNVHVPVGVMIRPIDATVIQPQNITGVVENGPEISLNWNVISPNYNYKVYSSRNSNFEISDANVQQTNISQPPYELKQGLQRGDTLYFRVAAISGGQESSPSERIQVYVPATTPQEALVVDAIGKTDGTIRVRWGLPNDDNANEYTLLRKKEGDADFALLKVINPNTSTFKNREYIDTAVSLSTTYIYKLNFSNYLSPPSSPDSNEASATTIDEIVNDNPPPVANAGADLDAYYGDVVTLDGGSSSDDEGIVSFQWTPDPANSHNVSIANSTEPQASFIAPSTADSAIILKFNLQVSDGTSTDTDSVQVTLTRKPDSGGENTPPEAQIDASADSAKVGETITLSALNSTDADGDTLSYRWNQLDSNANLGFNNSVDSQISFEIPQGVETDTEFNVLLEVSDGFATGVANLTVTVIEDATVQGDLEIYIETDHNPVSANDKVFIMTTITNNTDEDKENVTLTLDFPVGFENHSHDYISEGGRCQSYSECRAGEKLNWNIGTVPARTSTFFHLKPEVSAGLANGQTIPLKLTASASESNDTTVEYELLVNNQQDLHLQIIPQNDLFIAGNEVNYRLVYGFSGESSVRDNVSIEFAVPNNAGFVSASHNGEFSDDKITWQIGRLTPAQQGFVELKLKLDENAQLADMVATVALVKDDSNAIAHATTQNKIKQANDLSLHFAINQQPVTTAQPALASLVINNTSNNTYENVDIYARYMTELGRLSYSYISDGGECSGSYCDNGAELLIWNTGTLKPKSSTRVTFPVFLQENLANGKIVKLYAELEQSGSKFTLAKATESLSIANSQPLKLTIDSSANPIVAGEQLTYKLNYGFYQRSAIAEQPTLAVRLPKYVSFISATGEYQQNSDKINWPLTRLNPGETGSQEITVLVHPEAPVGTSLILEGALQHNNDNKVASFKSQVEVKPTAELELMIKPTKSTLRSNESFKLEVVVNNKSDYKRSNIGVYLRYPQDFTRLSYNHFVSHQGGCSGSYCEYATEFMSWSIEEIAANSSISMWVTPRIEEGLLSGRIVEIIGELEQGNEYSVDTRVSIPIDNQNHLELVATEDKNPAVPGELLTYNLTYSATTLSRDLVNATLETTLPLGAEYVAASDGAAIVGNKVSWTLGEFAAGGSGNHWVSVRVNSEVVAGSSLELKSVLKDIGISPLLRTESALITPIASQRPLELSINATPNIFTPDLQTNIELTVNNTSDFIRSGVWLSIHFAPEWNRLSSSNISNGGGCTTYYCEYDRQNIWWNLGDIAANGNKVVDLSPFISATAKKGEIVELDVYVDDVSGAVTREHIAIPIK